MSIDNKKIYDKNWEDWVEMKVHGPASRWLRVMIEEQLKLTDKKKLKKVLDVGCGEGTITHQIAQILPQAKVEGVDFSIEGIKLGQSNYQLKNLHFKCDLTSKSLDKKYDLITAFEVLEHVDNWQKLLEKMAKASNQYLLLSFPTGRMRSFEVNVGHFRNFKKGEVENFLAKFGFEELRVNYAGFPFYSPLYRELCNLTNSANNSFTKTKHHGLSQKIASNIFFSLFCYFSTRSHHGDQFCGLFIKKKRFKFY